VLPEFCNPELVASAMAGACEFPASTRIVGADNSGVHIVNPSTP
jgi:hypothetical protein